MSAWAGSERVAHIKVLGQPLGGKLLIVGPMRNINFPYVVLGRALLHHRMIEDRTHAQRDRMEVPKGQGSLQPLDANHRKPLEKIFARLRKQESLKPELLDRLAWQVEKLMSSATFSWCQRACAIQPSPSRTGSMLCSPRFSPPKSMCPL